MFVARGTFYTRRRWEVGESDTLPGEQRHSHKRARANMSYWVFYDLRVNQQEQVSQAWPVQCACF